MSSTGKESPLASGSALDARQQDLLVRYTTHDLSEDETEEVERLLSKSTQARKFLDRYTRKLPYVETCLPPKTELPASDPSAEVAQPEPAVVAEPTTPKAETSSWIPWAALVGAALSVGAFFGVRQSFSPSVPPKSMVVTDQPSTFRPVVSPVEKQGMVQLPPIRSLADDPPEGSDQKDLTVSTAPPAAVAPVAPANEPSSIVPPVASSTNVSLDSAKGLQSMLNFSHTGLTNFRAVLTPMQAVQQPIRLGFVVPELRLASADEVTSGASAEGGTPLGMLPIVSAPGMVAVEYGALSPTGAPFKVITQLVDSPWTPGNQLLLIGVQSLPVTKVERVPANLAFLIDVSNSMADETRLPLLRSALIKFLDQLGAEDRLGIVEYSGASVELLPSTSVSDRAKIDSALYSLQVSPGDVKGSSLQTAYDIVQAHYLKDAVNRVVLMTDGDLNVGLTVQNGLMEYIDREAQNGIGLSLIGVGPDILSEPQWKTMVQLGQGTYAQVSSLEGAGTVLAMQTRKPVPTSAHDVHVELTLASDQVKSYRLIGYENQWPQHPVNELVPGMDFHILSVYEIAPAEGGLAAHPLQVRSTFRAGASTTSQMLSLNIPNAAGPEEEVVSKLREIVAQLGDLPTRIAQQPSVSPTDKTQNPSGTAGPTPVVENMPTPVDGKVQPQDYQTLQQQAKTWMDPQSPPTSGTTEKQ